LVVPHKSGNVYVYDDVQQDIDYDVPTAHHTVQRTGNASVIATADSFASQDYDVPLGLSLTPASCRYDDDVDFGVGDYDLLSPYQRPASDVDGSISSNRSSVTSAGSLSSGCASVRSVHLPSFSASRSTTAAGAPRMNGFGPQLSDQSAARRCVSEATSDGSADSGIALQAAVNSPLTLNGVSCRPNDTTDDVDCLDYDVPVASINGSERQHLDVVDVRRSATVQRQSPSPVRHVSPVISDKLRHRDDNRCADNARRRRVDELRDCVTRSVQRFLAWTGRATGDTTTDAATARLSYGQAKLAGLAVRTSLKELVAAVDGNPPDLLHHHIDPLNKSLFEIDRRLDCLIASGSEGCSHRSAGRRAVGASSVCRDRLHAVAEVVADLPELVRRFTDFIATNSAVVVQPHDDIDVIQSSSSYDSSKTLPPTPPQRRDSHQRDRPPQSPPAGVGASPRARRPPLGKPPPVKPKPPKSVTWKQPPQSPAQPRPAASPAGTTTVNGAKHERQIAEVNKKDGPSTDDWNDDDCDYVSIVREVEREMESIGKPATKSSTLRTDPHTSAAPLNDDDRELLAFYATQIDAHAADVDAATAEFYRCCRSSPSLSPTVDAFIRRSRFVVLAAHRLVYVGDVIARHVTDQSVGDRIAAAANELCSQLKLVVMTTRNAALATGDNENPAAVAGVRQMMDSVRRATDDCRHLCDTISAIACQ